MSLRVGGLAGRNLRPGDGSRISPLSCWLERAAYVDLSGPGGGRRSVRSMEISPPTASDIRAAARYRRRQLNRRNILQSSDLSPSIQVATFPVGHRPSLVIPTGAPKERSGVDLQSSRGSRLNSVHPSRHFSGE